MKKYFSLVVLLYGLCLFNGCGGTSGIGTRGAGNSTPPPNGAPGFTAAGSMQTPRFLHTATLLTNGKVLIIGGKDRNGNALAVSELFDLSTKSFATTGALVTPRFQHTATLLDNGKVLVTGGQDGNGNAVAPAELFDPSTGVFTSTGNMDTARTGHTATLLNDGRV